MTDNLRLDRLEKSVEDLWDTINAVKAAQSTTNETLAAMRVTLETVADSVTKLVDGRGSVRCVEHQLSLATVRDDLKRCSDSKSETIGRVAGEFVAFREETKKTFTKQAMTLDDYKQHKSQIKGVMWAMGIVFTILNIAVQALFIWLKH